MAGLIPQAFIDELINRSDIVELIDSYIPLKKQGSSYVACCPFHNEKTPSFNVISKKQFYHCFGCGASGNVIGFMMHYLNLGFVEAIETLAAKVGMEVPRSPEASVRIRENASLYQMLDEISSFYRQRLKHTPDAIEYLKRRGVSGEIARHYELGYAPKEWNTLEKHFKTHKKQLIDNGMLVLKDNGQTYDRYRQRIMFPIRDRHGRLIGFGGRSLSDDQKPKYLNSPETAIFQKNRELYGLHQVLQEKENLDCIIVVEGYMDVIALAQHGIPNAVATLGTATSTYHIQLLARHCRRIVFCFDGDEAGRQAAWRALEHTLPQMNSGIDAAFVFLPEDQDPDSYIRNHGKEGFLEFINEAQALDTLFFQHISQNIDLSSVPGKSQLLNAAMPYIAKLGNGPFRELLIEELAKRTRIERHRIEQLSSDVSSSTSVQMVTAPQNSQRTPLRIAIALLIQYPQLAYPTIKNINLQLSNKKEHATLAEIIDFIREHPQCTTANIIENWRDTPLSASLHKLATWELLASEDSYTKELEEVLKFIQKQNIETRIQELLEISRQKPLNQELRLELQTLLRVKTSTVSLE